MASEKDVAGLWLTMTNIYGYPWSRDHGTMDDGTWCAALAKVSLTQLLRAIDQLHRYPDWPPTMFQFVDLCYGIPDIDSATQKLFKNDFSDPFVRRLKAEIGSWSLSNNTENQLRAQIKAIYPDLCKMHVEELQEIANQPKIDGKHSDSSRCDRQIRHENG